MTIKKKRGRPSKTEIKARKEEAEKDLIAKGVVVIGLVDEIKTVQGITKMLITRASIMNNDMIRIDTSVSSALNIAPDLHRIARAENFVEDGKIDARRD